jgi:hypothetical protein
MFGMAVIAFNGEPPTEPTVPVSISLARPSHPPNSSSATSTEAAPEPRTIIAVPRVPVHVAPPAQPAAVPKTAAAAPAVSPRASPVPSTPPVRLRQQSKDDDEEEDDDDC